MTDFVSRFRERYPTLDNVRKAFAAYVSRLMLATHAFAQAVIEAGNQTAPNREAQS